MLKNGGARLKVVSHFSFDELDWNLASAVDEDDF